MLNVYTILPLCINSCYSLQEERKSSSEWEPNSESAIQRLARAMGNCVQGPSSEYTIYIRTGDRKNAGTDANVRIVLHDEKGNASEEIVLDNFLRNDFERGALDQFDVSIKKSFLKASF